jgi:hypothetical protein
MRISVLFAVGALSGFPVAAAAQDASGQSPGASCICTVSLEPGGRVAALDDVDGQVLLSAAHGYAPLKSSAELTVGDRVVLMNEARAVLSAGATCRVELSAPSLLSVVAQEGSACIAQDTLAVAVEPAQAPFAAAQQLPGRQAGLGGLFDTGFFSDLGAFLGTKGVDDAVAARNLDKILPLSP